MTARNPSSGAYGLAQFINGPSEYFQYGGNPNTAVGQLTAMMNYIRQRYGDPNAAWAHEIAHNWYSKGGLVGYATGGAVTSKPDTTVKDWVNAFKSAQKHEASDYAGFHKAYWSGLAHAKKGTWVWEHRKGLMSELTTLKNRQASESAAYNSIIKQGTSKTRLSALNTKLAAEKKVLADQDLSHSGPGGHPGWRHGMLYWMGRLGALTKTAPATTVGPGGKPLPGVTHVYGGDVGNTIAAFLASNLSPLGARRGGLVMDKGGWLQPGWNPPIYNGLGRPERVTPDNGGMNVTLEFSGGSELDQALLAWFAKKVKVRGGGDVQQAFGQPNIRFVRR
jgi:hypothetical protein